MHNYTYIPSAPTVHTVCEKVTFNLNDLWAINISLKSPVISSLSLLAGVLGTGCGVWGAVGHVGDAHPRVALAAGFLHSTCCGIYRTVFCKYQSPLSVLFYDCSPYHIDNCEPGPQQVILKMLHKCECLDIIWFVLCVQQIQLFLVFIQSAVHCLEGKKTFHLTTCNIVPVCVPVASWECPVWCTGWQQWQGSGHSEEDSSRQRDRDAEGEAHSGQTGEGHLDTGVQG